MKHNKIALIGMMGSGKSAISKILAEKLNFKLCELDEIFEKEQKIKITDFFKKFGEDKFRKIESNILNKTIHNDNIIISCGGGIILLEENRKLLFNNNILSIYLKANTETLYKRIKNDKTRPLLLVENPKEEIEKILSKRELYYNMAQTTIITDNKSQNEIAEEILEKIWIK